MATTTPNYQFPKYEAGDLPNLLDEYNEFADKADAAIKTVSDSAVNAGTSASAAQAAATDAKQAATTAQQAAEDADEKADTISATVTQVQNVANDAMSLAQTNESDIASAESSINSLTSDVEGLQSSLNGKAPTNHASTSNQYGVGTTSQFGHVKLDDAMGSEKAANGVAATPYAIQQALAQTITTVANQTGNFASPASGGTGSIRIYNNPVTRQLILSAQGSGITMGAAGTTVCQWSGLPSQYRPNRNISLPCHIFTGSAGTVHSSMINVDTDGTYSIAFRCTGATTNTSFSGSIVMQYGIG